MERSKANANVKQQESRKSRKASDSMRVPTIVSTAARTRAWER